MLVNMRDITWSDTCLNNGLPVRDIPTMCSVFGQLYEIGTVHFAWIFYRQQLI